MAATYKLGCRNAVTESQSRISHRGIGNCVFHIICHRLIKHIARYISVTLSQPSASRSVVCSDDHSFQSPASVYAGQLLYYRIRNRDNAGVADHAVCFIAPQMPYRQSTLGVKYSKHVVNHFHASFRLND